MSDDFKDAISDAAQQPASASSDLGSVSARPIDELIQAHQHVKSQEAAQSPKRRGLVIHKLRPPGSI